jgi:NADH-quinone oxidoreductase subunit E
MTVRRLAEVQPDSFAFTPENEALCAKEIAKYPPDRQASAVIALLWLAQKQHDGWLPKPAIENVAAKLGMAPIRVLEVATFYTMFNLAPVGKYFIQFCGTTPCVLTGANAIKNVLESRIGPQGHVTADGLFSWLEVECLGACCNAPMVQINDDYYEDLTEENFNTLLDALAAGRPVKIGSQTGRRTSEPAGGLTSLTSLYGVNGWSGPQSLHEQPSAGDASAARGEWRAQNEAPAEPASERIKQEQKHSVAQPEKTVAPPPPAVEPGSGEH